MTHKVVDITRRSFRPAEIGPDIPFIPERTTVGLMNANPFAEGIANLGAQVITQTLVDAGFNVDFGFADTTTKKRPLLSGRVTPQECQVLAFSVAFEDNYHHVPRMLRGCGLSPWARERSEDDPVVVAGGMSLINPMPLSPFFDAMVFGDGRVIIAELVAEVAAGRKAGEGRREILRRLAELPYVWVPSLYRMEYDGNGSVTDFEALDGAPPEIFPARPMDLSANPITSIWTSPRACYKYDEYYSLMVAMGCHLKCPFCVVGQVQGEEGGRALNISQEQILALAGDRRDRFGTNLVKLFFASSFSGKTSIHPLDLKNLLETMLERGFESRVGSLNIRQADAELLDLVRRCGQPRVTFAPETSETLRVSVGKAYSKDDKLVQVAEMAGNLAMGLDVYTMVGIPEERPKHLQGLANLINRCRAVLPRDQTMEISVNPAFAKAQTPYERYATVRPEVVRSRFDYVRSQLDTEHGIEWVTVIDDAMCYYQPILALGGEELAPVIDELSESYLPDEQDWRVAVWKHIGDDRRYFRDRNEDERLPWQHIVYNDHGKMSKRFANFTKIAQRA